MDALVLSTLLINTAGIAAFALGMTLANVLPNRRKFRGWVLSDADAVRSVPATVASLSRIEAELPHAA